MDCMDISTKFVCEPTRTPHAKHNLLCMSFASFWNMEAMPLLTNWLQNTTIFSKLTNPWISLDKDCSSPSTNPTNHWLPKHSSHHITEHPFSINLFNRFYKTFEANLSPPKAVSTRPKHCWYYMDISLDRRCCKEIQKEVQHFRYRHE